MRSMRQNKKKSMFVRFLAILPFVIYGWDVGFSEHYYEEEKPCIKIELSPKWSISQEFLSQHEDSFPIMQSDKRIGTVYLGEPVLIAQAEKDEEWGYFQFPVIAKTSEGVLLVSWQMREDSHTSYGKKPTVGTNTMMSKDDGLTWHLTDYRYNARTKGYNVSMKNGAYLQIETPKSKNISSYKRFPKAEIIIGNNSYYKMDSLPEELQGVYFKYIDSNNRVSIFKGKLNDSELLRCSINELMPIVWWGTIKQISDNSLVAGVYPAIYLNKDRKSVNSGIAFYRSMDEGKTWNVIGKIPYQSDGFTKERGDGDFSEPDFEILNDSTFVCIMRSGSITPMYMSFSHDRGRLWTTPTPFTPNGVKPRLMRLDNGVIVLTSGRPGVQLRFCLDESGKKWTTPIDMVNFKNSDGSYVRDASCGYTSIIAADDSSFYMVYSNFLTKNVQGSYRKSIWFRKVKVTRN